MPILGRANLDHPALGATPKETVYAAIETLYKNISNDLSGRYFAVGPVSNGTAAVLEHGFGVDLAELKAIIYTGTWPNLTRVTDYVAAGYALIATPGNLKTRITVTAPAIGGPHTFAVWLVHGKGTEKLNDLENVQGTPTDGQLLTYNATSSKWEPAQIALKSEAASIVANTLTPTIGRPMQHLGGTITDLQMIGNPSAGKLLAIYNSTATTLKIKNLTGLTANNQIITGTGQDFPLKAGSACLMLYSNDLLKWILIGGGGGGGLVTRYVSFSTYLTTTLEYGYHYLVDTSAGGFSLALPVAVNENVIRFSDFASTWDQEGKNFTLTTTQKIGEQATNESLILDSKNYSAELSYYTDRFVLSGSLIGASSSSGSNGLTTVELAALPATLSLSTIHAISPVGSSTGILPLSGASAEIVVNDATGACSTTNFMRLTPGAGDRFAGKPIGDSLVLRRRNVSVRLTKAAGSTVWSVIYGTATLESPATSLGTLRVHTSNGYGSTFTRIRRWTTIVLNQGSGFTFNQSATNGDDVTITENGVYSFNYCDQFANGALFGLSKNALVTVDINGIPAANRLALVSTTTASQISEVSWTGYLLAGDVIRAHTDTSASGASAGLASFSVQQIAKG